MSIINRQVVDGRSSTAGGVYMYKVLNGATLIDGTGALPVEQAVLLINGDIIEAVGTKNKISIPATAEVIDLEGKYLLPGLIDTHIHMDLHGMADTFQENLVEDKLRTLRTAREMEDTLRAGFTTVRNVGSVNYIDFAIKAGIEQGLIKGPRILTSGRAISMTCSGTEYFAGFYRLADGPQECRKAAREQLKQGADLLKVMATGAIMNPGGVPGAPQLDMDEIKAVVDEGAKLDKHTAAHAHGARGIINAVLAGVRTIEHGTMADATAITMMADKGVFLVPTLMVHDCWIKHTKDQDIPQFMVEKSRSIEQQGREALHRAIDAGVSIAMGTDAGTNFNYHGNNSGEIIAYVKQGFMTPMQALQSATQTAAAAIQMDQKTGTLEKGKIADCLVLENNPLEDITGLADPQNIAMVIKGGLRVD
jgi:imidazolonepropionase-like amidohydrolase